jgi:SAM-dependent methyltransferase
MVNMDLLRCVICETTDVRPTETVGPYRLARCGSCGLEFTLNPSLRLEAYNSSYRGEAGVLADATPYLSPAVRLSLEARALWVPPPYLTAAERWVLRRLRERLPPGTRVVDIGCGTGRFLRAARRAGFEVVGIDPAPTIVGVLQQLGFDVREGALPNLGLEDRAVGGVTLFEVLEHLPDPVPALCELRRRFPLAVVGVSVPSPLRAGLERGIRGPSDYPPNHYLRWTPESLRLAFQRAGYAEVEIALPKPLGREFMPGMGSLALRWRRHRSREDRGAGTDVAPLMARFQTPRVGRLTATMILIGHSLAGSLLSGLGWVAARRAACRGRTSSSMALIAVPPGDAARGEGP